VEGGGKGEGLKFYNQKTGFRSVEREGVEVGGGGEILEERTVVGLRANGNASPLKKRTAPNANASANAHANASPPKPPLTIASKIQELEIESPVRAYAIGRKYHTPPKPTPNPTYATPERVLKAEKKQQQSSTRASTTIPNSNSRNFELTEAKNPNLLQNSQNLVQKVEKVLTEAKTVEKPKPSNINPLKIQQKKDLRQANKDCE
jgi:type V secretory pathway adhesin AidA